MGMDLGKREATTQLGPSVKRVTLWKPAKPKATGPTLKRRVTIKLAKLLEQELPDGGGGLIVDAVADWAWSRVLADEPTLESQWELYDAAVWLEGPTVVVALTANQDAAPSGAVSY